MHWIRVVICALAIGAYTAAAALIDVEAPEQYAAVLHTEEYVIGTTPTGDPSLFIGLFHMSVRNISGVLTATTTLWHQIEFAAAASIRAPGFRGHEATDILPLYTLASGPGVGPGSCPITTVFIISPESLGLVRNGSAYVEVTSGAATSGRIRGQLEQRRDVLIAFISSNPTPGNFEATKGMAIMYVFKVPNQYGRIGTMTWILSRFGAGTLFTVRGTPDQPITPLGVQPSVTLSVAAVIPDLNGISLLYNDVIAGRPLIGYNSSHINLLVSSDQTVDVRFVRIQTLADLLVPDSVNVTRASNALGVWSAFDPVVTVAMIAGIVLFINPR